MILGCETSPFETYVAFREDGDLPWYKVNPIQVIDWMRLSENA